MTFYIRQKVVCVAGSSTGVCPPNACVPQTGEVYTIRAINDWPTCTLLRLDEIRNDHLIGYMGKTIEPGFNSECFRPVKTTDISVFRAMLVPTPKQPVRTRA